MQRPTFVNATFTFNATKTVHPPFLVTLNVNTSGQNKGGLVANRRSVCGCKEDCASLTNKGPSAIDAIIGMATGAKCTKCNNPFNTPPGTNVGIIHDIPRVGSRLIACQVSGCITDTDGRTIALP
jgi:hypothetical protein